MHHENLMEKQILSKLDRANPKKRLENPCILPTKNSLITFPFTKKKVLLKNPQFNFSSSREVFPNHSSINSNELIFDANFECANLKSVFVLDPNTYSIEIYKDPKFPRQWFFFKASNFQPGQYTFIINGFSSRSVLISHNVSPVAFSESKHQTEGIGWFRVSSSLQQWKNYRKNWSFSFTFEVNTTDTIYFAYSYPYTYTMLQSFLSSLSSFNIKVFAPIKTAGKIPMPMIFWDSDRMSSIEFPKEIDSFPTGTKPLIIICARHHPGETNSSYAMESFIEELFSQKIHSKTLLERFSFLIMPMMNIDGVVCGYFRPGLKGIDYNRIWQGNSKITKIVDKLSETRNVVFFLDFHGHRRQFDSFIYTCANDNCKLNEYTMKFPKILSKICKFFDYDQSINFLHDGGMDIMRVAYHNRYWIPFSYTLEMSFGGSKLVKPLLQFTIEDYRMIGKLTCLAMFKFLVEDPKIAKGLEKFYSKK